MATRSTVRPVQPSERGGPTSENDRLEDLWIAAKHLDRSKIHRCLLNNEALDEIRQLNRKLLVQSSHEALVLHDMIFTKDPISVLQQSTNTLFDLSDQEKRTMHLRAMLLLPPYSLTPWEAISAIITTIRLKIEMSTSSENTCDASEFLQRKTICDIKIFFSSVCDGEGNADDHRSMDAQREMIKNVCKDITKLIYTYQDVTSLVCRSMFQLLSSLFQASLRLDDKIGISPCDDGTIQLSEFILINILNHNGCINAKSQTPALCSAISMASTELSGHLTTNHWRSLQQFVLDNIYTCTAIKELSGLTRIIIQGISSGPLYDNCSNEIWKCWVEILLHAYQKLSSDDQYLKSMEAQIIATFSVMQSAAIAAFISIVAPVKHIMNSDKCLSPASFREIQLWVRVNFLLLVFQSEQRVVEHLYVGTNVLSTKLKYEKKGHQIYGSARKLIDVLKGNNISTEDDSCIDFGVRTEDAMERIGHQFDHISIDACDSQVYFAKCRIVVRRSIFLNGDGVNIWSREYLWKELAHYLMSHYRPDGECMNYITFASAILVALYLELPSCQQGIVQQIVNILIENPGTDSYGAYREIGYCWVLFIISSIASKSNTSCYELDKSPFVKFSTVFQALNSSIYTVPRSVYLAMLQSFVCIPGDRMSIVRLGLKQVHCDKLSLHLGANVEGKVSWGYDGLLFLNQDNLQPESRILDKPALQALCFISNSIVGDEASSVPSSWRQHMLSKIIAACRSGFLHDDAIERILNATVARMLPCFLPLKDSSSCSIGDSHELELVTRNCHLLREIPFLVLLLLASLQQMAVPLKWRDLLEGLILEGNKYSTFIRAGITDRQVKIILLAISFIKALVDIPLTPSIDLIEDEHHLYLLGWQKLLCEREREFWTAQNIDICPSWSHSPSTLNLKRKYIAFSLSKEVISSMRDQIACSLADGMLCLWIDGDSTNSAEYEDEFKYSFLVNSLLSCLHFPDDRTEGEGRVPLCFRISVLEIFFKRSAKIFQAMTNFNLCGKGEKAEYVETTLSVLQMMSSWIGALPNCSYSGGLSTLYLYRDIVEFYSICWDHKNDDINPDSFSQAVSRATVSTLNVLLQQSSVNFFFQKRSEIIQICQCHCKLFNMICRDLNELTSQSLDQVKMMGKLISCLEKLCNSRQFICFENFEIAQTCADCIRASWEILWNTLQNFEGGKRSVFKSLISIAVSRVPSLLRILDRLTGVISSSSSENPSIDKTVKSSYSVASFKRCVEDYKSIASVTNRDQLNPKFSWMSTNGSRIHAWSLSVSVENIASLWANANPTNTAISLLDKHLSSNLTDLQNPRSFRYAIERVSELEISLSLFSTLLQITDTEISSDKNQQLYALLWEIMSTVSSSVDVITSSHERVQSIELDNMKSTLSLVEAIVCIFSVMKVATLSDKFSELNIFVNFASEWCERQSEGAGKFNGVVHDLNEKLIKCSQKMKVETNENRVICNMFKALAQDKSFKTLPDVIDDYLESSGFDLTINKRQKLGSSNQRPGRDERSKKRRRRHRIGRKRGRSRNKVVNEWLGLDQCLDKESANDGFGDLDDFILPG